MFKDKPWPKPHSYLYLSQWLFGFGLAGIIGLIAVIAIVFFDN